MGGRERDHGRRTTSTTIIITFATNSLLFNIKEYRGWGRGNRPGGLENEFSDALVLIVIRMILVVVLLVAPLLEIL